MGGRTRWYPGQPPLVPRQIRESARCGAQRLTSRGVGRLRVEIGVLLGRSRSSSCRPASPRARRSTTARARARARHPLPAARQAPAARERRRLAGEADPRLRRQRLPRRRVPLPGLPLRRPRRAGGARRIPATRAPAATRSRAPNGTYTYPTDPAYAEQRRRPRRAARQAAGRRDRLPDHAQHDEGPGPGRRRRSRSAARPQPREFPHGANATAPGAALPHRPRHRAPTWSTRPRGQPRRRRPRHVDGLDRPPPDRGASSRTAAWDPGQPDRSAGRRRRAVGRGGRHATWCPGAAADATQPGGAGGPRAADGVLQRRLPLRRAVAARRTDPTPCSPTRPGGATASRARRWPTAT